MRYIVLLYTILIGVSVCVLPQSVHADTHVTHNISATISPEGIVPGFSVSCATASSTGATQYLLRSNEMAPLYKSFGVTQRVPCVEGVAVFQPINIKEKFETILAGIPYAFWFIYYDFPQSMFVKDTTGLCEVLCNLVGAFNNYDNRAMLPEDTLWPTLGGGPAFTYDGSVWSNTANGSTTPIAYGLSNVLFIPGFEASRLYKTKSVTCQNNCEDQLWESNTKSDVEDLYMNTDGTPRTPGVYTRDAIDETNTPLPLGMLGQNIYKTFFATLNSLTESSRSPESRMARWEAYAYDWRQSVDDIVENGTPYENGKKSLVATLQGLVASSTNGKVTIVAHSNGGLLAKALLVKLKIMKDLGQSDLIDHVDTLVLVASPQIGTALAVPAVLHGYDQRIMGGALLDEEHARELGRNIPGAYGLLPSRQYISTIGVAPVTFTDNVIPSSITTNFVTAYGSTTDTYGEYTNFLLGNEGRTQPSVQNTKLPIKLVPRILTQSDNLHQSIDGWVPPVGLRIVQVAGWGLDTVASMQYYPKLTGCTGGSVGCANAYALDEKPLFTVDGDKTVVEPSALYMTGERYWVNFKNYNTFLKINREHKDMLEVNQLNNLISSVIQKKDIVFDTVVSNTKPTDTTNRIRMSVHSPVSIGSYDIEGNFTGKVCPDTQDFCYIQENIPNSSYFEFGEGKYINVSQENLKTVSLQGTDSGTFTFISEKVSPTGSTTVSSFTDIPVTTQTQGQVTINQVGAPQLALDVTGDGTIDITLAPTVGFDPVTFLEIMKKTVESFDITKARKTNLTKRIDAIIKLIQKGKITKAQLKADRFKTVLEKKIQKPIPKKPKIQRMTNAEVEVLIGMLETLLDNLEK